jgi:hypothetical protein
MTASGEALWRRYEALHWEKGAQRTAADAIQALVSEQRADERAECCKAIRAACGACDGTGFDEAPCPPSYVSHDMVTDAESPEMEGQAFDPGSDGAECEYCGRPIAAIRSRIAAGGEEKRDG